MCDSFLDSSDIFLNSFLDEMLWFSYKVRILKNNLAKNKHLSINNNLEFAKKGIPEKIIQIASSELNRDIQSSSITFQVGNYLTPPFEKLGSVLFSSC